MHKGYLRTAALLGALSVALGAFGAHALKKLIDEHSLTVYETAVRYQFYHVFALALAGILYKEFRNKLIEWSGFLFILGILFFSGSLYGFTFKAAMNLNGMNWLGPVTPNRHFYFFAGGHN